MNVEEFEKRAESIVDDELDNIKTVLKKIPDPKAKEEADRLGLSTIDVDIKNNPLAVQHFEELCSKYDIRTGER